MEILRPLFERFMEQIEGIRNARDPDHIHDMRVASRRLRAALPVFSTCFKKKSYQRWRKEIRRITRALGKARDRDVQILFLQDIVSDVADPDLLPGLEYLLRLLHFEREVLQQPVEEALDQLENRSVFKGFKNLVAEIGSAPKSRSYIHDVGVLARAREDLQGRIEVVRKYEPGLQDPQASGEHHQMRIAAKQLRYRMEVYSPLVEGDLLPAIKKIRKLQEALGDLHDTTVWMEMLPRFLDTEGTLLQKEVEQSQLMVLIEPGIRHLEGVCAALRSQYYTQSVERWNEIREEETLEGILGILQSHSAAAEIFLQEEEKSGERMRYEQIVQAAEKYQYEEAHTHQVTRLALELFEDLYPLHRMGNTQKKWLQFASILHDIGYSGGVKGHQKRGLALILADPDLPFTSRERTIIGSIVRYHGSEMPSPRHRPFGRLSSRDQYRVSALSGILRLADALDVSHEALVCHIEPVIQKSRVILYCDTPLPSPAEESAFLRKKNLFETVFGRSVELSWRRNA
jgi:CHAD domain-containing protein